MAASAEKPFRWSGSLDADKVEAQVDRRSQRVRTAEFRANPLSYVSLSAPESRSVVN